MGVGQEKCKKMRFFIQTRRQVGIAGNGRRFLPSMQLLETDEERMVSATTDAVELESEVILF